MKHTKIFCLFLFLSVSKILQAQSGIWKPLPGPEGARLNCSSQLGANWYIGTGSGIFQSSDQGDHWSYLNWVPRTLNVVSLDMRPGEILIGATEPDFSGLSLIYDNVALMYRSTDEGQTWTVDTIKNDQVAVIYLSQVFRHRNYIFAVSGGFMLRSADNGHNWSSPLGNNFYVETVQHNDSLVMFNTSFDGPSYSRNGGNSWQVLAPPPIGFFANTTILGKENTFIVTESYQNSYKTTNFGSNWQSIGKPFGTAEIRTGKVLPDGNIVAMVDYPDADEMIFGSSNNGQSWQKLSGSPFSTAIDVVYGSNVYGVATLNGFYKNYAPGNFLNPSNSGLNASNISSMLLNGNQFLAGNLDGLWRSVDQGANWFSSFPQTQLAGTVDIKTKGDTLCALTTDNFYYSTDAGDSWIAPYVGSIGMENPFYFGDARKMVVDGDNVVVTGQYLNQSTDFGVSWDEVTSYDRSSGITVVDGDYYAMAFWDGIIRSTDQGLSWEILKDDIIGEGNMHYLQHTIFAASDQELLYSKDLGQTWFNVSGIPKYNQYYELPVGAMAANDSVIYAGVNYAGVYQSKDGGISWTLFSADLPNPRFNDMLLKDGVLYAACTDGGIWYYNLLPVGTQAPAQTNIVEIIPNPTRGAEVQVIWNMPTSEPITVQFFDALGRCVSTQTTQSNEGQTRLPISNLKPGAYRVLAVHAGKSWSGTFIRI